MRPLNESARSFTWLKQTLRVDDDASVWTRSWNQTRDAMRATTQTASSLQDWVSDFWLCKTAQGSGSGLGVHPAWDPPARFDAWPAPPRGVVEWLTAGEARPTNHAQFADLLATSGEVVEDNSDAAVAEFAALDAATTERGDVAMIQAQYVRAWLKTALGNLLSSMALAPQSQPAAVVAESHRRLLIPRQLKAAPVWGIHFAEGEIGLLYNCRQSPFGSLSWGGIRVGQGEEWMRHWQWLSVPVDGAHAVSAIVLAARLLRCRPLVTALTEVLASNDRGLAHVALGVGRRWLLTLKAMTWLEDALSQTWARVRAQDLACFAFNAVKPEWPRRFVAVSHRSLDAKTALRATKAWRSSLFAIDANYAPSWETNTGMIWGLFAATPVLAKVLSSNYRASEWCQREEEMFEYLERTCDFLDGRYMLDTAVERVAILDRFVDEVRPLAGLRSELPEFPPLSMVYFVERESGWPLRMLRAAAALRVIHAIYGTHAVDAADRLAQLLCTSDSLPPIPPPTNNQGGWSAYREIFRDLQNDCGLPGTLPLWFPQNFEPWPTDVALAFADRIPDLSRGQPALTDVLAAIEWQATLLPLLQDANLGDMTMIDLRGLTQDVWESEPALSMARGIAALRAPTRPIWFMQSAGQGVERWGLPDDRPIFTEYDQKQFAWMMVEGSLSPEWPAAYAERCGLILSPGLLAKCHSKRRS